MGNKKKQSGGAADAFFNAIERVISSFIEKILPRGGYAVLSPGEISDRFAKIEAMEPQLAVIEADKLVDTVLKKAGVKGETLGERLRGSENMISRSVYSDMWEAHKVRNQIVHDHDFEISSVDHIAVVRKMKRFLVELGAFKNER